MKKKWILAIGCVMILLYGNAFAACSSSCSHYPRSYCSQGENPCACTDPNRHANSCMSTSKYCQVFGNIGALD